MQENRGIDFSGICGNCGDQMARQSKSKKAYVISASVVAVAGGAAAMILTFGLGLLIVIPAAGGLFYKGWKTKKFARCYACGEKYRLNKRRTCVSKIVVNGDQSKSQQLVDQDGVDEWRGGARGGYGVDSEGHHGGHGGRQGFGMHIGGHEISGGYHHHHQQQRYQHHHHHINSGGYSTRGGFNGGGANEGLLYAGGYGSKGGCGMNGGGEEGFHGGAGGFDGGHGMSGGDSSMGGGGDM